MRRIAARVLKLTTAAALLMLLLMLAQTNAPATAAAVGGLAVAGALWWWWRRPEGAASVMSLVVTLVLTSQITFWVGVRFSGLSPLQLGYAFWLFAGIIAAATWLAPRHRGSRALTIALGHAALVVASLVAAIAPSVAPVVGFAVAMVVVVWRSRPRPWTPQPYDLTGPAELARGTGRTYDELCRLDDTWTLLGPQTQGKRRKIEQVLEQVTEHVSESRSTCYVVETRQWGGAVELQDVDGTEVYVLDNDPLALTARLAPIVELAQGVRRERGGAVEGVVVLWDGTSLPDGGVVIDVIASQRGRKPVRVHLVRGEQLTQHLAGASEVRSPGRP